MLATGGASVTGQKSICHANGNLFAIKPANFHGLRYLGPLWRRLGKIRAPNSPTTQKSLFEKFARLRVEGLAVAEAG